MTKPTRGPWLADGMNVISGHTQYFGVPIASCSTSKTILGHGESYKVSREEAIANADLIAAVHELLAEVIAVEWIDNTCPRCHQWKQVGHLVDCSLQAAIAKARGKQT